MHLRKGEAWVTEWAANNVRLISTTPDMPKAISELLQFKELFRGITGNTCLDIASRTGG